MCSSDLVRLAETSPSSSKEASRRTSNSMISPSSLGPLRPWSSNAGAGVQISSPLFSPPTTGPTPGGPAPWADPDSAAEGKLLVATYRADGRDGVWNVQQGTELARIKSTRGVTHGVVISPDSRYAFVTAEGRNSEPGALDVIDLSTLKLVATVPVGLQAGGIAFYEHAAK